MKSTICQGCKKIRKLKPKIIPEVSKRDSMRSLLLCKECYQKHETGGLRFGLKEE